MGKENHVTTLFSHETQTLFNTPASVQTRAPSSEGSFLLLGTVTYTLGYTLPSSRLSYNRRPSSDLRQPIEHRLGRLGYSVEARKVLTESLTAIKQEAKESSSTRLPCKRPVNLALVDT